MASACVWCSTVIQTATWITPSTIPFHMFKRPYKTDKLPWGPAGPCQTPKPLDAIAGGMEPARPPPSGSPMQGPAASSKPMATGPLGTSVVPGSDTGVNVEDKQMHDWWKKDGGATMTEDEGAVTIVIPKPPKLADFQPTRLQAPFMKASRFAEVSFLVAVVVSITCFLLIPLNAIHLYNGQFFFIMVATGASITLTLMIIKMLEQFAKKHCKARDKDHYQSAANLAQRKYNLLATQTR